MSATQWRERGRTKKKCMMELVLEAIVGWLFCARKEIKPK